MVVYLVRWNVDAELSKGKGRAKMEDFSYCFTVLCRSISDASHCLSYLFTHDYKGKFALEDGVASFSRMKLDSRNFNVHYLYMDKMRQPLSLSDVSQSLLKYSKFFVQ